jgi:histidinol dehydrogenase
MITQPIVAAGYIPKGLTANTYSPSVNGCTAVNSGSVGVSTIVFDEPIADVNGAPGFVVTTAVVNTSAAAGISAIVELGGAQDGFRYQFAIELVDDAHAAIDAGVMFTVTPLTNTR